MVRWGRIAATEIAATEAVTNVVGSLGTLEDLRRRLLFLLDAIVIFMGMSVHKYGGVFPLFKRRHRQVGLKNIQALPLSLFSYHLSIQALGSLKIVRSNYILFRPD
jgi:hypothetical protein